MGRFHQDEHDYERENRSVITRTTDGLIKFWNDSAEKLYGWRKEEALGKVSHDLLQTDFPKPLEEIESELVRNGRWEGVLFHTTRHGDRLAVESRWTLDPALEAGTVVESNARSTEPGARLDLHPVETREGEPLKNLSEEEISDKLGGFANFVLGTAALFCLLISTYVLYQYGWSGQKQFSGRFGLVAYYVVPAALTVLFFLSLQLRRIYKLNIAIFCLAIGVSVYAAELFLTFWTAPVFPPGPIWGTGQMRTEREKYEIAKIAKQFGVQFDTRTKLELIDDLRRQGVDAVPNVFPRSILKEQEDGSVRSAIRTNDTEVLALAGISDKVTVLCNETGAYTIYRSDEHGFHNPAGIWSLDRLDVAAVGDSFAHGACVPSDRNFVSLIRKRYPATLNIGVSGNGPLLELASLKEYLPRYRPKVVLWLYFEENDLGELKRETKSPLLKSYMERDFSQRLLDRQSEIDDALIKYVQEEEAAEVQEQQASRQKNESSKINQIQNIIKLSALREKLGVVYGNALTSQDSAVGPAELNLFREILANAKSSTESWNGKLYFVYLPEWDRYGRPESANKHREAVLKFVEELNIPVVDLDRAFQARGDPLSLFPFRRFGHYNEEGNRVVAETVLAQIAAGTKE